MNHRIVFKVNTEKAVHHTPFNTTRSHHHQCFLWINGHCHCCVAYCASLFYLFPSALISRSVRLSVQPRYPFIKTRHIHSSTQKSLHSHLSHPHTTTTSLSLSLSSHFCSIRSLILEDFPIFTFLPLPSNRRSREPLSCRLGWRFRWNFLPSTSLVVVVDAGVVIVIGRSGGVKDGVRGSVCCWWSVLPVNLERGGSAEGGGGGGVWGRVEGGVSSAIKGG